MRRCASAQQVAGAEHACMYLRMRLVSYAPRPHCMCIRAAQALHKRCTSAADVSSRRRSSRWREYRSRCTAALMIHINKYMHIHIHIRILTLTLTQMYMHGNSERSCGRECAYAYACACGCACHGCFRCAYALTRTYVTKRIMPRDVLRMDMRMTIHSYSHVPILMRCCRA
jgi:hypothetical protein